MGCWASNSALLFWLLSPRPAPPTSSTCAGHLAVFRREHAPKGLSALAHTVLPTPPSGSPLSSQGFPKPSVRDWHSGCPPPASSMCSHLDAYLCGSHSLCLTTFEAPPQRRAWHVSASSSAHPALPHLPFLQPLLISFPQQFSSFSVRITWKRQNHLEGLFALVFPPYLYWGIIDD